MNVFERILSTLSRYALYQLFGPLTFFCLGYLLNISNRASFQYIYETMFCSERMYVLPSVVGYRKLIIIIS